MKIPGVPEGWEIIAYRVPIKDDTILIGGQINKSESNPSLVAWPIVRKVEAKPEPDPGEGYRWVNVGEMIKSGDEYREEDGNWYRSILRCPCNKDDKHTYRRKVETTPEPDPGEGWRWVKAGENFEAGDEYLLDSGEWFGIVMRLCGVPYRYRRRIGLRLRQRGERIEALDQMMNARGKWQYVPLDMVGLEVVGGWYRTGS